ncbi:YgaP family membrane protein [Profundibacter sp.]|uniref:YgaP family membrane protein n=1 Tax=Profundibacter sp. TaxID=3101071 RepID=UPI003D0BB8FC
MLKKNVGNIDRIIRFVVGAALIIAYFVMDNASPWLLIGIIPLAISLMSSCPAYTLLGLNTCPLKDRSES